MIPYQSATVDLYLRKLIDWEEYYRLRSGDGADAAAERTTLEDVLGTAAQICSELEPELRAGWHQAAKLVGGEVVYPPHIKKAYDTLAAAGLVSFGVAEAYGGYGLPAWVTNVILQMIARADAGPHDDHRAPGRRRRRHPDLRLRRAQAALPARLRVRRADGRDGPHRAAGRLRSRRDPHARDRDATARSGSTARRSSSRTAARRAPRARARRRRLRREPRHDERPLALPLPAHAARRRPERRSRSRGSRRSSASTARRPPPSRSAARGASASARRARASARC